MVVDVAVVVIVVVLVVAVVVVLVVDIVVFVVADVAVVVGLVVCSAIVHGVIAHHPQINTHPNNQKQTKCTKTRQFPGASIRVTNKRYGTKLPRNKQMKSKGHQGRPLLFHLSISGQLSSE